MNKKKKNTNQGNDKKDTQATELLFTTKRIQEQLHTTK